MSEWKRAWLVQSKMDYRFDTGHLGYLSRHPIKETPETGMLLVKEVEYREITPPIPRRSCGHPAEAIEYATIARWKVICLHGQAVEAGCWEGPMRRTKEEAIRAWTNP